MISNQEHLPPLVLTICLRYQQSSDLHPCNFQIWVSCLLSVKQNQFRQELNCFYSKIQIILVSELHQVAYLGSFWHHMDLVSCHVHWQSHFGWKEIYLDLHLAIIFVDTPISLSNFTQLARSLVSKDAFCIIFCTICLKELTGRIWKLSKQRSLLS